MCYTEIEVSRYTYKRVYKSTSGKYLIKVSPYKDINMLFLYAT